MNNHSTEQRRDLPRAVQILCGRAGTWTSFPTFLLWFSKRPRWFQSVDIAGFFLWPWSHISVQQSGTIFSASLFNFASVPVYLLSYRRLSISLRKFWLGRKKKKKGFCHLSKISSFWSSTVSLALGMIVHTFCKSQASGLSANVLCFFCTK